MTNHSWEAIKKFIFERANACCEYCQTCEYNTGQAMHTEHIIPNNGDNIDNLCLACPNCNLAKSAAIEALDTLTNEVVPLFNPRNQMWSDHFEWSPDGLFLHGKTATGRATIIRLKMNRERIIRARQNWIIAGTHPPA